jgi:hypothetical protein
MIMTIRFDEKGKFFTDLISKETVPVTIQTLKNRMHGHIHVRPGSRLKDEINQADLFLAMTEATIFDDAGQELYQCEFIAINRAHIVWILPDEEVADYEAEQDRGED